MIFHLQDASNSQNTSHPRQLLFIVRVEDGGDFLGGVMRRETDFNAVTGVWWRGGDGTEDKDANIPRKSLILSHVRKVSTL